MITALIVVVGGVIAWMLVDRGLSWWRERRYEGPPPGTARGPAPTSLLRFRGHRAAARDDRAGAARVAACRPAMAARRRHGIAQAPPWDYKGSPFSPRKECKQRPNLRCDVSFRPWRRSAPWPRAAVVRSSRCSVSSARRRRLEAGRCPPTACSSAHLRRQRHRRLLHQHPAGRRAEPVRERLRRELHQQPAELPASGTGRASGKARMTLTNCFTGQYVNVNQAVSDNGSIRMFFNFTPT